MRSLLKPKKFSRKFLGLQNYFLIILKLPNHLRRSVICIYDKEYINKKISKRKGECKKCGKCCRGCIHLDKKSNLCKIYSNRPLLCHKNFPLDKLDQKIWNVKDCGYSFE